MHKRGLRRAIAVVSVAALALGLRPGVGAAEVRRILVDDYVDRMTAGWIGQMIGVGWGAPTEFHYMGQTVPEDAVPRWSPDMVNQYSQDDLYVEMTFIKTLEDYGFDCSAKQAGIDFASSQYPLWHANLYGRKALRSGIAPPDSGHPANNAHADDIDYQIEADFAGLLSPGMPRLAIELGEKFGSLMNYGDGIYGGQFVAGMYSEAFFERDPLKLVEAGLRCIPRGSQYSECIRDVVRWWKANPDDWTRTWSLVNIKYHLRPEYRAFSCSTKGESFNIDAKINGAYIVMGMLYGGGELERTVRVSMRCGQDSDCNPSNAAGILCTALGTDLIPAPYRSDLVWDTRFVNTPYNMKSLVSTCSKLARQAVVRSGGKIIRDEQGREVFEIPVRTPVPSRLVQSYNPMPPSGARYDAREMAKIKAPEATDISAAAKKFAPGWKVTQCGPDMSPGLLATYNGKQNVLLTHPLSADTPCVIRRVMNFAEGSSPKLNLVVSRYPLGDWMLRVRVNGKEILAQKVDKDSCPDGSWMARDVDLSEYSGRRASIEVFNEADGWSYEAGYFAEIKLVE